MNVRVVWLSLNPDAIARGYWDQGMLEALFSGELWAVPGGPTYEHHECRPSLDRAELADVEDLLRPGAVLVVPARHHAEGDRLDVLRQMVNRMRWCLLILTGDEEGAFPVEQFLLMPNVRAWVMSPQGDQDYGDAYLIGSGWPPGIRDVLRDWTSRDRTFDAAFAGQVTHERRKACIEMLYRRASPATKVVETEGFTQGWAQPEYWKLLADAKVAPCPSGPVSPDSFRVYEALEAGAIPMADDQHPGPGPQVEYWEQVFGATPFPLVHGDWATESETIDWLLAGWPDNQHRVFSWWQRQKRRMAYRLITDLERLAGRVRDIELPAAAVTAIVVTSPTPRQPALDDLETTLASIAETLPGAETILVFDGIRPELEHRRDQYREYITRALWAANTKWRNVVPVVLEDWQHQANATRAGLQEVASRHMLFVEHDTPLTGSIDWPGVVGTLDRGELDVLRLHHETAIGEHHAHMMLDTEPLSMGPGLPVVRTYQWSQRPHVAPVGWYRRMLDLHFAPEARCMIEDAIHGVVSTAWIEYGLAGWQRFRLGLYAPPGNIQRSLHLDSRRLVVGEEETGDPKFPMLFAYPGEPPAGAPAPGRR